MSAQPGHSPDRRWWWDGVRWLPAVSPDGRWFFDGVGWLRVRRPPRRLRAVFVTGGIWLFVLSSPWLVLLVAGASTGWTTVPDGTPAWLIASSSLAVVMTLALGVLLALRRWWAGLPIGVGAGVLLIEVWYVALLVAASPPVDEPGSDDAWAVGGLFLGVGGAVAIAVLLALGGAAGAVWRSVRAR